MLYCLAFCTPPHNSGGVLCYTVRASLCQFVHLLKLCIGIDIGEE